MTTGERIYTPRFCTVTIKETFQNKEEARSQGYTEPTYYESEDWEINGKSLDMYHMIFAAYRKEQKR